jgi:hypothetical protein
MVSQNQQRPNLGLNLNRFPLLQRFFDIAGKLYLLAAAVIFLCFYLACYKDVLIDGTHTFRVRDTVSWTAQFYFFVEAATKGIIPFWNPYNHGGEPFYFFISIFQFFNPLILLPILLAKARLLNCKV